MMQLNHDNSIYSLADSINSHGGMTALRSFGKNLKSRPLNKHEIKILMATLWAFYKETPSVILSLALRLNDFWKTIDPWEAMAKSAYLLSTAIDEFGLSKMPNNFLPTHHQLFKKTNQYFGISSQDLLSEKYILNAGKYMSKYAFAYYRKKPLPLSLGFHFA